MSKLLLSTLKIGTEERLQTLGGLRLSSKKHGKTK
jgi:hypothetical protein